MNHHRKPAQGRAGKVAPARRKRWLWATSGVLCVGVVGLLVFALSRQADPTDSKAEGSPLVSRQDPPGAAITPDGPTLNTPVSETGPREPTPLPVEPTPPPVEPTPLPVEPIPVPPQSSLDALARLFEQPLSIEPLKEEAIAVAVRLTKDFPNCPEPFRLLAGVHKELGNSTEADRWLRRCLELDPQDPAAIDALAQIAFDKAEYQQAAALWRRVVELAPENAGGYSGLGQALVCSGEAEDAIAALGKYLELSPGSSHGHLLLGQQYLQLKDYQKAKSHYEAALAIQPNYFNAYYGLAMASARLGEKEASEQAMEKFRQLKVREMQALKDRDNNFDDLVSLRRSVARTHTRMGRFYSGEADAAEAEALWRRAAFLDAHNVACRVLLAAWHDKSGRKLDALQMHEQLADIEPGNAVHHVNFGILSAEVNRLDAAEQAFRKAAQMAPKRSWGPHYLAKLYFVMDGKLAESRALAQTAVQREPNVYNYLLLSEACDRNGDLEAAMAAVEQAIRLEPANPALQQIRTSLSQRK
ncbi:MAG: tetratricopeptide repeat protein [Pirellulales bacterium]|nr:tetratricopeptide repeat protein [Pirellulales bacterium]